MLTIVKTPRFIEAAFNPIIFEASYSSYQLGDMFFLEIYDETDNLLGSPLVKNGNGFGFCAFDISSIIQSIFPTPKVLNPNVLVQHDETALVAYKVKMGIVKMVNRAQQKAHYYTSGTFHALRAALALDNSESIDSHVVDYTNEARFLTSVTPNLNQTLDIFLPVLITAPTTVKLVCNYYSSRKETTHFLPAMGVHVFNARPELQGVIATSLSVWLESEYPTYLSTVTATAECGEVGYIGSHSATVTEYSGISLEDAHAKAMGAAAMLAEASKVCVVDPNATVYTSTKTVTLVCSSGYEGTYTSTQTRTSYVSQADADHKATQAAQADATANLTCQPVQAVTYTSTQSYTAQCEEGFTGSYTSTQTRTSTVSQADADQQAQAAAESDAQANLQCSADTYNAYQDGYDDGYYAAMGSAPYRGNTCPTDRPMTVQDCEDYKQGYDSGWVAAGGTPTQL